MPVKKSVAEVFNVHEQCASASVADGTCIALTFHPGHSVIGSRWAVVYFKDGAEMVTDKAASWYDNKHKTFTGSKRDAETIATAKQWVQETFHVDIDWVRNKTGDFVPRSVNERWPIRK